MSKYPYLVKPLKGAASFSKISEETSQSQAAILLMLGRQLGGDDQAVTARARAAAKKVDLTGLESDSDFPVPKLRPTATRVSRGAAAASLRKWHGAKALDASSAGWGRAFSDSAARLYDQPSLETAGNLFEMCLSHPVDLVRISAAAAYFPVSTEPSRLIRILAQGCKSQDHLERNVAATALARIDPGNPALRGLTRPVKKKKKGNPAQTAMLIHGTWASDGTWWQPGGDFHTYIKGLRSDLYSAADRFQWTGGYSDGARAMAAADLKTWVEGHNESGLDLIGHSHGASVMMLATANGMRAGKLVLLSCPVHVDKYFPNFSHSTSVHSVRVRLDLVILADRGGQKFVDPRIKENVLPIWFNHSATHDPAVWKKYKVPAKISL